ncbi:hypothetical protein D3C72_2292520 [compost metagenome]
MEPHSAAFLRGDRSDHVNQLRQAGHPDPIGMLQHRNQAAADDESILHVIDILALRRGDLPAGFGQAGPLRLPHIPFV